MASVDVDALVPRLAAFISDFIAQLSSHRVGSLAQIWLPEKTSDGSVELYTQGLPYSINGVGDLLALFRCISCKYKFATDPSKALQMGAVGRVFTSGEPEMSHNVQRYDQHVYLRAAEAQRCRVHSTLFMPLYDSPRRDACVGVFEVVLTDPEPNFAGMVGWIISCLSSEGLYTAEVDTASLANQGLGMSLVGAGADRDGVSALESGAPPRGAMANGRDVAEMGSGAPAGAVGGAPTAHSGGGGQAGRDEVADRKQGAALPQAGRSPTGAASPPPQQEQKQGGGEGGSGSGAGSGQPPSQPPLLSGSAQQHHHHLLSQLGSGQLGSAGSLLAGLMQGSVHHSGADLPSAGGAGEAAAAVAAVPPAAVAAALQQVLQQGGTGMLPQQQLAALLGGGQGLPPLQLPGGATPAMLNGLGASPAMASGLRQQDVQPPPPSSQQQQQQQQQQGEGGPGGAGLPQNGSLTDMATAAQQAGEEDDMDEETDDDQPFLRPAPGAAQKYGQGNRILTYDDLAAQFGYGLKEAAARLNICPTTLKRACRRLGVPRWPRREIARHKKAKQSSKPEGKGDGSKGDGTAGGVSQQQGGGGPGSGPGSATVKGLSSGSGGSGPQQQKQQQQPQQQQQQQQQQGAGQPPPLLPGGLPGSQLVRPASSSLLTGLSGLEQLLPLHPQLSPASGGGLPPELAAALASTLTQQAMQHGGGPLGGLPPQLVGPVMQLLQQNQGVGALAAPPQPPLSWQAPAPQAAGLPPGLAGLPPLLPIPRGGLPPAGAAQRQRSPPPAPSLSNLGLPMRADSKLHSAGPVGSLDILAHADLEMSVGNGLSLGNGSPRLALSNLGGLSQLGLSGFDFGASLVGGAAPAATATGGAGGATGPQNGPAHSSGAVSKPREKH